jgi:hypothetical protein
MNYNDPIDAYRVGRAGPVIEIDVVPQGQLQPTGELLDLRACRHTSSSAGRQRRCVGEQEVGTL